MKQVGRLGLIVLATAALIAFIGTAPASAAFKSTQQGLYLSGTTTIQPALSLQGSTLGCESGLQGTTSKGAPNTQDLHPGIRCFASGYGWSVEHTSGCLFRFDQYQNATLHSCSNGGIELTWDSANYHCAVLIPNQTVPVTYKNGGANSYLEANFSETAFQASVTKSEGQCYLKVAENTTAKLNANYKVQAAGGSFWFDPTESEPSLFHTAASASIAGTPVGGTTTFKIDGAESLGCQVGGLAGSFPAATSSKTLGELAVGTATGSCSSSWWGGSGVSIDQTGCKYVLGADGKADLGSCSKGGITVTWNVPAYFVKCKVFIPNQTGASTVTYRNHGVSAIGVRATLALSLSGEVTEASGWCPYSLKKVTVTQESVTDVLANGGADELWFG
jgi:hypothetical protein